MGTVCWQFQVDSGSLKQRFGSSTDGCFLIASVHWSIGEGCAISRQATAIVEIKDSFPVQYEFKLSDALLLTIRNEPVS